MTEFKAGDEVRATFTGTVQEARSVDGSVRYVHLTYPEDEPGSFHYVPESAIVELVKPVDDPSTDPIGTVRVCGDEETWVHVKRDPAETAWRCAGQDLFEGNHRHMAGTDVVGAVPNTPAWEAWRLGTLRGAPPFPFVDVDQVVPWTGDGSEEPPAHVVKVQDKHGCFIARDESGWSWLSGIMRGERELWERARPSAISPFVEVID